MGLSRRRGLFVTAGALAFLILGTDRGMAGPNEDAFAAAGYTLCDARLLQLAYGDRLIKRVIRNAGESVRTGQKDRIDQDIARGREVNAGDWSRCPAEEVFTLDEIRIFAARAKMESVSAAEERISRILLDGGASAVRGTIEAAR